MLRSTPVAQAVNNGPAAQNGRHRRKGCQGRCYSRRRGRAATKQIEAWSGMLISFIADSRFPFIPNCAIGLATGPSYYFCRGLPTAATSIIAAKPNQLYYNCGRVGLTGRGPRRAGLAERAAAPRPTTSSSIPTVAFSIGCRLLARQSCQRSSCHRTTTEGHALPT